MNNRIVVGIVVVIVVIAGVFLMTRNKGQNTEVASNTEATSQASATSTQTGSIKSLIAAGKSQKCTYSVEKDGASSEGTIYVGNGKMRGDFTTSSMAGQSHMIIEGTTMYMWSDDGKMAFKMAFDPNAVAANANTNTQTQQPADIDQNYDFDCEGWSVDNSKFELPSGVTFNELPNFSAGAAGAASGLSAEDQQAAIRAQVCNSLSGAQKEQCLSSIQ